jgi:large subunit ribosomal protein L23
MLSSKYFDIIIKPMITEKATTGTEQSKYTFVVAEDANKVSVKEAVEKIFNTEVKSVNILNKKPKTKVFKGVKGKRSGFKKAIVTLKAGKTIEIAGRV